MENLVRKLRSALGLSQVAFGQLLGRSYQSVGYYERGVPIPPAVVERLIAIATENNLADIAMELAGGKWQIKRVLQPGETLISNKLDRKGEKTDNKWHTLLDEVLGSGNAEAISAVQSNLVVFSMYVRSRPAPRRDRAKGA